MIQDVQQQNQHLDSKDEFQPNEELLRKIEEVKQAVEQQPEYYRNQLNAAFEFQDN